MCSSLIVQYLFKCLGAINATYADDLVVLVNSQKDVDVLTDTVNLFGLISSAKVNWGKSEAVMVGERLGSQLTLPANLTWKRGGLRYLEVFLGDENTTKKSWDNVLETVTVLVLTGCFTVFTKGVFICGFKYTRQKKEKSQLLNFVLGLAKMAAYVSRRRRVERVCGADQVQGPTGLWVL